MNPEISVLVVVVFIFTVLITLGFFYRATNNSRTVLMLAAAWIVLQSSITLSLFYTKTNAFPPRFFFLVVPLALTIILLFVTKKGRAWVDTMELKWLTALHVVRIPVELCLYWLFIDGMVPELMTFAGKNFDILSGITAPIVLFMVYYKKIMGKTGLLVWNFICLILVLFIVVNAVLSAPFPIQQFAFDQPNLAVFYFPMSMLPGFVVPVVIISHLASIRLLIKKGLQRD